ncbi:MAG: agmatinase [Limnochordaceae bacterium]|nr:agmatinase [Limnochordaceae bacterium]
MSTTIYRRVTPFLQAEEQRPAAEADVVLLGAPFDATTSFRPGTRFGPERIRFVSYGLEVYSPLLDDELDSMWFSDYGDLDLPLRDAEEMTRRVESAVNEICQAGARPLMLGGEHTVSVGAIWAVAAHQPGLTVLHLDAHADWRDCYLGDKLCHATAIRRAADRGLGRIIQIGIRSGGAEEWREAKQRGDFYPGEGPERVAQCAYELAAQQAPVYLTLDIDVLDPAFAPGTGTAEPGGWTSSQLLQALQVLSQAGVRLVGADVVEVAPPLDAADITSIVASKVVRELAIVLHRSVQRWGRGTVNHQQFSSQGSVVTTSPRT